MSEPPTPSRRLSSTDAKPAVAANRQTEPLKLGRFLRGELDWVVMKALAKERDRRYQSASGLAGDVERFLNHEPVLAGPPSALYRLRKFVRRNRAQVLAGCLLLAALLAGIGGTTFGMIRAERARADEAEQRGLAEANAAKAEANEAKAVAAAEAAQLARKGEAGQRRKAEKALDRTWEAFEAMTDEVTGDSLTTQQETSAEQKKFLTKVLRYYQEFAGEKADDEPSQFRTAAAAYRVGLIEYRLGREVEAAASFGLARDRLKKLAADFPAVPAYRQSLAGSHNILGLLLRDLGKWPQAEEQLRKALGIREKLAADSPAVPAYRQELAVSHNNLGLLLRGLRKGPQAEEQLRKAVVIWEKLAADFPAMLRYQIDLGGVYANFGSLLSEGGQPGASLVWYEKAIRTLTPVYEQNRQLEVAKQFLPISYQGRALAYVRVEKFAEAVKDWDTVIELSPKADRAKYQIHLGGSYCNLGNALRASGRLGESLVS